MIESERGRGTMGASERMMEARREGVGYSWHERESGGEKAGEREWRGEWGREREWRREWRRESGGENVRV